MCIRTKILAVLWIAAACSSTRLEYRLADGSIGPEYPRVNLECSGYADLITAQLAAARREPDRIQIQNEVCVSYDCGNMGQRRDFAQARQEQIQESIANMTEIFAQAATRQEHYGLCMQVYGYSLHEISQGE